MKHVMYAEKSLLMDDESADALIDYAAAVAASGGGDTVRLHAVGDDGNEVTVTFLLNSATVLIVETATAKIVTLDNDETVSAIHRKIQRLRNPPPASSETPDGVPDYDFDELS